MQEVLQDLHNCCSTHSMLLQLAACSQCHLGAAYFIASFKFYRSCDGGLTPVGLLMNIFFRVKLPIISLYQRPQRGQSR